MKIYSIETRFLAGDFWVPDEISDKPKDILTYIYKNFGNNSILKSNTFRVLEESQGFINNFDVSQIFEDTFWAVAEIKVPSGGMKKSKCNHDDFYNCCANCPEVERCDNILSLYYGRNRAKGTYESKLLESTQELPF